MKNDVTKFNTVYSAYKAQAKKRGKTFDLTIEEASELFREKCFYCGDSPKNTMIHKRGNHKSEKQMVTYQGIDRVDPEFGYVLHNIVPCCSHCNYAKRKMTHGEFIDWISRVYKNRVQRPSRKRVGSSEPKQGSSFLQEGDMV